MLQARPLLWGSSPATHHRGCCTMMGSRGQPSLSPRVPMEWNVCRASVPRHKELLHRRRGGAGSLQMPRSRGLAGTAFVHQAHDFRSASGGGGGGWGVAPAPRAHCLVTPESSLGVPPVQPAPMQPSSHRLWFQEVLRGISSATVDPAPGSTANILLWVLLPIALKPVNVSDRRPCRDPGCSSPARVVIHRGAHLSYGCSAAAAAPCPSHKRLLRSPNWGPL